MLVSDKKYDLDRVVRSIISIVAIIGGIMIINYLSPVLWPFVLGFVLAYVLEPVVKMFMRVLRTKRRVIPVVITLLLLIVVLYLIFRYLVPGIVSEFASMAKMLVKYAQSAIEIPYIPPAIHDFLREHLDINKLATLFSGDQWLNIAKQALMGTWSFVGGTLSVVLSIGSWLLVLLYMFFIMLDYDKLSHDLKGAIPHKYRRQALRVSNDVTDTMSRYFRGQALVSLFVGIIFAIEFAIIGLPMAVAFGLFIGLLNMVPYLQIGSIPIAAFLCVVKSVATGCAFWPLFFWVIVAYVVCQLIQDIVLIPIIMKQQTGLNAALIFLSLSLWAYVLGFIGLIIGLPLTTLIISYYSEYVLKQPSTLIAKQKKKTKKK